MSPPVGQKQVPYWGAITTSAAAVTDRQRCDIAAAVAAAFAVEWLPSVVNATRSRLGSSYALIHRCKRVLRSVST